MQLEELLQLAEAGQVEVLDLHSLEGGIYLLQVSGAGQQCWLERAPGQPLRLRSVEHARDVLRELHPPVPFHLVQASAYDEMCGLSSGQREPLRVPISLASAW